MSFSTLRIGVFLISFSTIRVGLVLSHTAPDGSPQAPPKAPPILSVFNSLNSPCNFQPGLWHWWHGKSFTSLANLIPPPPLRWLPVFLLFVSWGQGQSCLSPGSDCFPSACVFLVPPGSLAVPSHQQCFVGLAALLHLTKILGIVVVDALPSLLMEEWRRFTIALQGLQANIFLFHIGTGWAILNPK